MTFIKLTSSEYPSKQIWVRISSINAMQETSDAKTWLLIGATRVWVQETIDQVLEKLK